MTGRAGRNGPQVLVTRSFPPGRALAWALRLLSAPRGSG
jgi:hypothetical protein